MDAWQQSTHVELDAPAKQARRRSLEVNELKKQNAALMVLAQKFVATVHALTMDSASAEEAPLHRLAATTDFWTSLDGALRKHVMGAAVAEKGCRAMINNLSINSANMTKLGEVDACEVVVMELREHMENSGVATKGCVAVYNLARFNPANQAKFASLGARALAQNIAADISFSKEARGKAIEMLECTMSKELISFCIFKIRDTSLAVSV